MGAVGVIDTFEKLAEHLIDCIHKSEEATSEGVKAQAIGEGVMACAEFMLAVVPTNMHHRNYVASVLVRGLRDFKSPFIVLAREQEGITEEFNRFMTATEGWQETHH